MKSSFSIVFFWNVKNTHFGQDDFLQEKYNEAIKRTKPEELKNYLLEKWQEWLFTKLAEFQKTFEEYFYPKVYTYESDLQLFEQLLEERIKFQNYSAQLRGEAHNHGLVEHLQLFGKAFFHSISEEVLQLSERDNLLFLFKIAFHDFWRVFSHEECFHQDLEAYLGLMNSDSEWKKIEGNYDDMESLEAFERLSKFSLFYTLLDICSKKRWGILAQHFWLANDQDILKVLKNPYYQQLDFLEERKKAELPLQKTQLLRARYDQQLLKALLKYWFPNLWAFETFVHRAFLC